MRREIDSLDCNFCVHAFSLYDSMPPCAYSFHSLLRCIVRENNSEIRVHAAMLPNFCSLASRLVGKLIIIISHVPKSVSKTLFFRFPESRNFHFCLTDSVSWEHIFRLPRQICEKYLRNNVIGMFDLLSVHSQQHGRHTTTSQELTQTRHRYVNVFPPSIVAFQRRRHASNRRARQEHTKIKKVSDTIRIRTFFRRFRGPSCERPSAHVSTLQISKKLLSDQRRVLE
jgi:hypothetical protein